LAIGVPRSQAQSLLPSGGAVNGITRSEYKRGVSPFGAL
jgi:hypothetical protein